MEEPTRPEHHRERQRADHPFPGFESKARQHRDHDGRDGEERCHDQPTSEVGFTGEFSLVAASVIDHDVAERLDLGGQAVDPERSIMIDPGSAIGEVDLGVDHRLELLEPPLDAAGAGCARHPVDPQIGTDRGIRAHAVRLRRDGDDHRHEVTSNAERSLAS